MTVMHASPTVGRLVAVVVLLGLVMMQGVDRADAVDCHRWASATGDDANPGTYAQPKRTLRGLVPVLAAGETGCIKSGETIDLSGGWGIINAGGGAPGQPVTVRTEPGGVRATVQGLVHVQHAITDLVFDDLTFVGPTVGDGKNVMILVDGDRVTFSGNEITYPLGICMQAGSVSAGHRADDLAVSGNRIHNCGTSPVLTWTAADSGAHGMYLQHTLNAVVSRNYIYDNKWRGLQTWPNTKHTLITRNVFDGNGSNINIGHDLDNGHVSEHTTVSDNIISNATLYEPEAGHDENPANVHGTIPTDTYGNVVSNNCVYHVDPTRNFSGTGYTQVDNTFDDPQFVDRAAKNFSLQPDSPCADKGPESGVDAGAFTVTGGLDAPDTAPGDGSCADGTGACTLRAAVQEANALGAGTIALTDGLLVTLALVGTGEDAAATGDIDITGDVAIVGGEVSAAEIDRVFDVQAGGRLMLTGLRARDGAVAGSGGGVRVRGGGVLTAHDCALSANTAEQRGGALHVETAATADVSRCRLQGNAAGAASPYGGGGVSTEGEVVIAATTIDGNEGYFGGGIGVFGGATTAINSTLSANRSHVGGGVYVSVGTLDLAQSTVTENAAGALPGGNDWGGGGVMLNTGNLSLAGTIVASNQVSGAPGADCRDAAWAMVSRGYNLVGVVDSSVCPNMTATGDLTGTPATPLDPRLLPLADNGGQTLTHGLQPASPARNTGNPADCPTTDQRGMLRPQGPRCDIGAVEALAQDAMADFTGDGMTDFSFYRPSNGRWFVNGIAGSTAFGGQSADVPVPGDYTGDGTADFAIYRPGSGRWYVHGVAGSTRFGGVAGDVPVPGDYTGDGTADLAIYRPGSGRWYVHGVVGSTVFGGQSGDVPVPADYTGDGTTDFAVYRPSNGRWYVHGVAGSTRFGGVAGDVPVPGDYTGDSAADFAVYRPGSGRWYLHGGGESTRFGGVAGDVPVPGEYTGDGTTDLAIYRPGSGRWYVHGVGGSATFGGLSADRPLPLPHAIHAPFFGSP